jgi:RNA polymerase sigma factor (sigma-70 family)
MMVVEEAIPGWSGPRQFTTTHWSVVLAAAQGETPESAAALERLCRTYWYPLYAHIRRRGRSPEDAQDLTQGFFRHLLERKPFARLHPDKGRFRSFLLAALNYFLADEHDRQNAQKRGGGREIISLDAAEAEARYRLEPTDDRSPDRLFERHWALALLDQVLARLEQDYRATGRDGLFQHLKPFLVEGGRTRPYAEVATDLGLTEEAVKKAVQRLRKRYGLLFREEIAHTLADPAEVEDELRFLSEVMSR